MIARRFTYHHRALPYQDQQELGNVSKPIILVLQKTYLSQRH
jgi:hypothetical protein